MSVRPALSSRLASTHRKVSLHFSFSITAASTRHKFSSIHWASSTKSATGPAAATRRTTRLCSRYVRRCTGSGTSAKVSRCFASFTPSATPYLLHIQSTIVALDDGAHSAIAVASSGVASMACAAAAAPPKCLSIMLRTVLAPCIGPSTLTEDPFTETTYTPSCFSATLFAYDSIVDLPIPASPEMTNTPPKAPEDDSLRVELPGDPPPPASRSIMSSSRFKVSFRI